MAAPALRQLDLPEYTPAYDPAPAAEPCPECGRPIEARFCGACGEARLEPGDSASGIWRESCSST